MSQTRETAPSTVPAQDLVFQFIVTTGGPRHEEEDQKLVRHHARRNRLPRNGSTNLMRSWMSGTQSFTQQAPRQHVHPSRCRSESGWIPPSIGHSPPFSQASGEEAWGLQTEQDVIRSICLIQDMIYPTDLCSVTRPTSGAWFPSFWTDATYSYSLLFSLHVLVEKPQNGSVMSIPAMRYLSRTMNLLQARLNEPDPECAASDATIMTVISLFATAAIYGDLEASKNHVMGLHRLVELRGGFRALAASNSRVLTKICKADAEFALFTGRQPLFISEDLCWDTYIAGQGLIRRPSKAGYDNDDQMASFMEGVDPKLSRLWDDMREFSKLSNLAYQTSKKIPASVFNEFQVSILYRLIYLKGSCEDESYAQAAPIISGLLAFAYTVFLQRQWRIRQLFRGMVDGIRARIGTLRYDKVALPPSIRLWTLMMLGLVTTARMDKDWEKDLVTSTKEELGIRSWSEARSELKKIMWIDCLHDDPGSRWFASHSV